MLQTQCGNNNAGSVYIVRMPEDVASVAISVVSEGESTLAPRIKATDTSGYIRFATNNDTYTRQIFVTIIKIG